MPQRCFLWRAGPMMSRCATTDSNLICGNSLRSKGLTGLEMLQPPSKPVFYSPVCHPVVAVQGRHSACDAYKARSQAHRNTGLALACIADPLRGAAGGGLRARGGGDSGPDPRGGPAGGHPHLPHRYASLGASLWSKCFRGVPQDLARCSWSVRAH